MTCRHCKKAGHVERVWRFNQADLNKASRPQAHSVEIQEVNKDKSEYSSDNGEDKNEEVYIEAYHINTDGGERNEIMIPGFSIRVSHTILYIRRIGWRSIKNYQPPEGCIWRQWTKVGVGKGNICLIMTNDNHIKITDVYYVPEVPKHLLSVGQATNNGLTIEFTEN